MVLNTCLVQSMQMGGSESHVFPRFTGTFCVSPVCSLSSKSVSYNILDHDVTFISINDSCVSKN